MTTAGRATRTVAAFDFDGTITNGPSLLAFLRSAGGLAAVTRAAASASPWLAAGVLARGRTRDRAKERLLGAVLRGRAAEEVRAKGEAYARGLLGRRLRPELERRIGWHRASGHELVIVSASPQLYIEPAGRILGMDAVLCTRMEVAEDGRLTGRFEGANCRGGEKARRLADWIGDREQARVWAYGNSGGDAEMLRSADVAVVVGRRPLSDLP